MSRTLPILVEQPRDLCLFTLGINTAYRANELLSLKVGQVQNLRAGDVLDLKQRKTHKYRPVTLNPAAGTAIQSWLAVAQLQEGGLSLHGSTRMFDSSHHQYVSQVLVPGCGVKGELWQSLIAEDMGLLAATGAGDGDSAADGGV
ncbi:MAG TPA: hypothetical protein V6D18_03265, partial [Thermosynechococcaceae cyanobacterium]